MLRDLLKIIFRFLFWLLSDTKVEGYENVPDNQGFILAVNHLGVIDAPLVFKVLHRRDMTALVAKKHRKNLLFLLLVNAVNGIWLNRDEADTQALRAAFNHLRNGGILGIAPEGTRTRSGTLIEAKTGIAYIADKADVPVLPVAITGTHRGIKKLMRFQRPKIKIRFGEMFTLPKVDRKNREADLKRNTDEIMCRIAIMLPPSYRGIYADHPCLKRLETEQQAQSLPEMEMANS